MKFILPFALLLIAVSGVAQDRTNKKESNYKFTVVKEVGNTSVKDQYHSGTCWCFSTSSFIESELLRMGKGNIDLGEMFTVRWDYMEKAEKYVRMMGKTNFGPGGEPHDVINCIRNHGLVPQSAYPAEAKPKHGEMDDVLKAMLDEVIKTHDGKISTNWKKAYQGALDGYLGTPPEKFDYNGKSYTPQSFAKELGINPDDYVEMTSFTHHPFYESFAIEVPDNWAWEKAQNVPINEMEQIVDNALNNGYTVAWGADVSETGFSYKNGLAILPEKNWEDMRKTEKDSVFTNPVKQKTVTQADRQEAFDNLSTQDDHGMQIVGSVKDQLGQKYYIVKNSWGTEGNDCGGYFYCSASYFEMKTLSILVHKTAIPKDIAKKMKIAN